jgi:hypothetical protein
VSTIQAISLAQADFEGLFMSLKAAAQPGACVFRSFGVFFAALACDSAAVSQCHMSLTLVASVTGLVSGQNSAQMSIDAAAREAMGFISEHLKVAS